MGFSFKSEVIVLVPRGRLVTAKVDLLLLVIYQTFLKKTTSFFARYAVFLWIFSDHHLPICVRFQEIQWRLGKRYFIFRISPFSSGLLVLPGDIIYPGFGICGADSDSFLVGA